MRDDFAIFVLSHKRPDTMVTVPKLRDYRYKGKIYIVLDTSDPTIDRYKELYGEENILIFDKDEIAKITDLMDNFNKKNAVIYSRNVCFDFARKLGLKYFAEFDDDYVEFTLRYPLGKTLKCLNMREVCDLDDIFELFIDFLEETGAKSIAFAQSGEMSSGVTGSVWKARLKRKVMNTFFFKVPDDPKDDLKFIGTLNEDVNTYLNLGSRGNVFLTCANLNIKQVQTQKSKGGITELYSEVGTYAKSFYSVIIAPSCVKISTMGETHKRIHHVTDWDKAVPKIISDRYRKKE